MPFIGERINRVQATRGKLSPKMEIKSNVDLSDVSLKDLGITATKKGVSFSFTFKVEYSNNGGSIEVDGELFYLDDEAKMKEIDESWKKDKKLDEKLRLSAMNRILEVSYMQAIVASEQVKLPPPIQLPRFVSKKK